MSQSSVYGVTGFNSVTAFGSTSMILPMTDSTVFLFRHLAVEPDVARGALTGLLHGHSFIGSMAVVVIVLFCGVRAWGMYTEQSIIKRTGVALIHTMILQVVLGIASFVVVPKGPRDPEAAIGAHEVVLTTAHQVIGAILLAVAAAMFVWQRRLLRVV